MSDIKIVLHDAHVTQYSGKNGKSAWHVRKNGSNEDLAELPGDISEAGVFSAMRMAREFELKAFNIGIELGKEKTVSVYDALIKDMSNKLQMARDENERLACALEKHILSEE